MCKGVVEQEERIQAAVRQRRSSGDPVPCELCGSRASLYCEADEAYLCGKCDQSVHGANFLAMRHVRCLLCNTCQSATERYLLGASTEVVFPSSTSSVVERISYGNYHCDRGDDFDENCSQLFKTPCLFL